VKLGLFGGTFDPPHTGHLIAAQDACSALGLDRVIFVPARIPPHKQNRELTPAPLRLSLLRAAVAGDDRFEVDDLELEREGPSYTVDTVRVWRSRHPDAELYLLLGADQYAEFDSWRDPAAIRADARIAVLSREGVPAVAPTDILVPVTRIDISSTEVRRRTTAGEPIRYLVPDAVAVLIRQHGLYGDVPERAKGVPNRPGAAG
jgi:nicotinate-nucleotide adenylyltransferase